MAYPLLVCICVVGITLFFAWPDIQKVLYFRNYSVWVIESVKTLETDFYLVWSSIGGQLPTKDSIVKALDSLEFLGGNDDKLGSCYKGTQDDFRHWWKTLGGSSRDGMKILFRAGTDGFSTWEMHKRDGIPKCRDHRPWQLQKTPENGKRR